MSVDLIGEIKEEALPMRFSIQSKMIVGLLLLSLTAAASTGLLGYRSGRNALMESVYERMTAIRKSKTNHVANHLKFIRNHVQSISDGLTAIAAAKEFVPAFEKLRSRKLTAEQESELRKFYQEQYFPELQKHVDTRPQIQAVFPDSDVARYLQYGYLVRNPHPLHEKSALTEHADGTEYAQVHQKFHGMFNTFISLFGYEDIMLLHPETLEVVYSVAKEIDFGTSYDTGPFSSTGLAEALERLRRERDKDSVSVVDFEPYRPSFGLPAAFTISPIFDGMSMVGILAVQFPIDRLNTILSGDGNWEEDGLGKTGEVFLVGEDHYMRNESRFFTEDPKKYAKRLLDNGFSKEEVEKTERFKTSILTVRLESDAIDAIFRGKTGIGIMKDYMGDEVLASYAPLDVEGLRWGIVAKIPTAEAFEPIRQFTHDLLSTIAIIGLVASLVAGLMGGTFARPVRKLTRAASLLGKGNYGVRVQVNSRDEFADLGRSFNRMASEIEMQKNRIEEKVKENERLLESMLPAPVAARLRSGPAERQSDTHSDVSVIFAAVDGFDAFSESLEPAKALELLNRLVVAFDEAAEIRGVEKLKSIGASYLAVCGLSVPRFDHSQRAVAFALDAERIINKFNKDNGADLTMHIGIHRGPVTGGIIGRHKFIYDLWGRTIDIAKSLGEKSGQGVIRISKDVYERVADIYECRLVRNSDQKGDYVFILDGADDAGPRSGSAPSDAAVSSRS